MLAHHHALLWNASELGGSFGVAGTTGRSYLDNLTVALVEGFVIGQILQQLGVTQRRHFIGERIRVLNWTFSSFAAR